MERGSAVNSTQYQASLPCSTTIGGWFFMGKCTIDALFYRILDFTPKTPFYPIIPREAIF